MDELGYKISIIAIVIILIVGACMLLAYVTLMGLKIAKTRSNRVNGETGKTSSLFPNLGGFKVIGISYTLITDYKRPLLNRERPPRGRQK